MTRAREAHRRGDDFAQLRPHAATRVDDEPDRHRRVFVAEQFDRHATPVVVHDEPVAIETRDELSALVGDDNRQHDELTRSAAECWGLMRIRREERQGQDGRQKGKNEGQESKRSWEKASYPAHRTFHPAAPPALLPILPFLPRETPYCGASRVRSRRTPKPAASEIALKSSNSAMLLAVRGRRRGAAVSARR